jgi:hypothetical protein
MFAKALTAPHLRPWREKVFGAGRPRALDRVDVYRPRKRHLTFLVGGLASLERNLLIVFHNQDYANRKKHNCARPGYPITSRHGTVSR